MKTFPTLYKRTKTGAIQQWHIQVRTSDMLEGAQIKKTAGQLGGKQTEHIEPIHEGKQKRTAYEQANLQAESDWKKKQDEGYKTKESLGITEVMSTDGWLYLLNGKPILNETGSPSSLEVTLDKALPQFNTDASGNAKPMLAKTVNWDKVKYPCLIQPKLDGVRCLMVADFTEEEPISFLSRSGKTYFTLNHISKYVTVCVNKVPINFILDGEIYSEELTFQEIVAAVKKQRPESLKLKFRAYDVVNESEQNQRWIDTVAIVELLDCPFIQLVPTLTVYKKEKIKEHHDNWVSEGYEGAMIRHLDGTYGQGQRSSDLLKVKEFDDSEFLCVGLGTGQREEDVLVCCETAEGRAFNAKLTGTREYKAELVKNWDNKHKFVTIKHFGWTDEGLPRFPIGKAFRDE